jgi:cellobiose epimerase
MKKLMLIKLLLILNLSASIVIAQQELSVELKKSLTEDVLNVWYPATIDTLYGGFLTNFDYKWQPSEMQTKMLVSQTRQVWTTSKMFEFLHDNKYKLYAKHGIEFLKNKMWDYKFGGFYFLRDRKGNEIPFYGNSKTTYSNAFAIYCLTVYYKISKDTSALNLAKETFLWLEQHAHDSINKGYFDLLNQDGTHQVLQKEKDGLRYFANPMWKDQNSSIHLLEAFTELYSVWPDKLLKERLTELLHLIRDVITTPKGYLTLYLTKDWQPISFRDSLKEMREANYFYDHVSFGHDIETAYLMLEASEVLGITNDSKTLSIAKIMVDHALANGWDNDKGGFYYEGYYFKNKSNIEIVDSSKVWWVQAEGLNATLLMSKLFSSEKKYYETFLKQWQYIKNYLIDHKYHGWFSEGTDSNPDIVNAPKAYDWKANYHNVRALMNCIELLEK